MLSPLPHRLLQAEILPDPQLPSLQLLSNSIVDDEDFIWQLKYRFLTTWAVHKCKGSHHASAKYQGKRVGNKACNHGRDWWCRLPKWHFLSLLSIVKVQDSNLYVFDVVTVCDINVTVDNGCARRARRCRGALFKLTKVNVGYKRNSWHNRATVHLAL